MTQDSRGGESRGDRLVKRERGAFRPYCIERLGAKSVAQGRKRLIVFRPLTRPNRVMQPGS